VSPTALAVAPTPADSRHATVVTVRPAPRREPPFDDELRAEPMPIGARDQRLPFETVRRAASTLPPPRTATDLPDPVLWGRRLLIGIIETAGGRRPLQQLGALLSPGVATGLGAHFERAAQRNTRHWTHEAVVRSVRGTEPAHGVAEVCATVEAGTRVRAVALRLEAHEGRWRCTRLQLG
jgi:hypothetical protein